MTNAHQNATRKYRNTAKDNYKSTTLDSFVHKEIIVWICLWIRTASDVKDFVSLIAPRDKKHEPNLDLMIEDVHYPEYANR